MQKYFKNFILCGDIEYYCLLCQELFQGIPDVEKHIRWEKHRKSLKSQAYFPKFRKDFIYKVANNFYCEICNFVSPDIATATNHINNEKHMAMKKNPLTETETKKFIGQYESGYIVIKKVILNMAQWNAIVDKKCHLCNCNAQNLTAHLSLEEHRIKLIQSETKDDDGRYYRKINKDKYHCFTCKKIFTAQDFNDHWPNCENIDEIEIKSLKQGASSKNSAPTSQDIAKMADLEKQLIGTLQEFYLIDEQNSLASCKHCNSVVPINFKSMIEHMKAKHNNEVPNTSAKKATGSESSEDEVVYMEITDCGKRRSELSKYGKQNSIKLNYKGSKGWCLICNRYLPANKKNFKEHIKGVIHRGYLELQGVKKPQKHERPDIKTKGILQCNLQYAPVQEVFWINNEYSIDVHSFFLICEIKDDPHFKKTSCLACNELFPQGQERQHCETPGHKSNFLAAKFVHADVEFIREIRPNLFHCGFCNQTFPFFEPLRFHLNSYTHLMVKVTKTECNVLPTIKIKNKADDVYKKLLQYGFGNDKQ